MFKKRVTIFPHEQFFHLRSSFFLGEFQTHMPHTKHTANYLSDLVTHTYALTYFKNHDKICTRVIFFNHWKKETCLKSTEIMRMALVKSKKKAPPSSLIHIKFSVFSSSHLVAHLSKIIYCSKPVLVHPGYKEHLCSCLLWESQSLSNRRQDSLKSSG